MYILHIIIFQMKGGIDFNFILRPQQISVT